MFPTDLAIFCLSRRTIPLCTQRRASGAPRAAHVCAASFSWCGKIRSEPPPWISKSSPSSDSAIAEHSMCQPGRPRPQGESQAVSSPGFCAFQSAKSSGSRLRSAPSTPSPWSICSTCWCEISPVARVASGPRSTRRRRPHTHGPRSISRCDQLDDLADRLARQRLVVGPPEPERIGVGDVALPSSPAPAARCRSPAARGRGVDLVVDIGDVCHERDLDSPRGRGIA